MGNLDRRSFLKGGVVAAGAAAFAGALSACAPSAPQETGAADETLATTGEAWYGSPADPAILSIVKCSCAALGPAVSRPRPRQLRRA